VFEGRRPLHQDKSHPHLYKESINKEKPVTKITYFIELKCVVAIAT
jgi:hypothetical protein